MTSDDQPQVEKIKVAGTDRRNSSNLRESKLALVCRQITFVLVLLYIVGGPFYKHVLNGKSTAFRSWKMFHARGLGLCDVEFYIRRPDGRTKIIDRFKTLGYDDFLKAPRYLRRIKGAKDLTTVSQLIRQEVGQAVDLRINARIATRKGWETLYVDKPIK